MQLKTILNRVQKFKSFVYSAVRWVEGPGGEPALEAELRPRTNARARCSICGGEAPGYDRLAETVSVESPVHTELVIQRITGGAGLKRAGARIREAVMKAIRHAASQNKIVIRGEFLWSRDMQGAPLRDRSEWSPQEKKLELVAPEELHGAIEAAVSYAFSCGRGDAISGALGLLGFKRVTNAAEDEASRAVDFLISSGRLIENDSVLSVSVMA
jgi:hypothetical protein